MIPSEILIRILFSSCEVKSVTKNSPRRVHSLSSLPRQQSYCAPRPLPPPLPRLHSSVMAGDGVRRPGFLLINTWLHSERMNRICTCPYITLQMVGIMRPFVLGRRNERRRELSLLAFSSSFLSFAFYSQLPHFLFSLFRFFFFCHYFYISVFSRDNSSCYDLAIPFSFCYSFSFSVFSSRTDASCDNLTEATAG